MAEFIAFHLKFYKISYSIAQLSTIARKEHSLKIEEIDLRYCLYGREVTEFFLFPSASEC
jgi:hypothetical protein